MLVKFKEKIQKRSSRYGYVGTEVEVGFTIVLYIQRQYMNVNEVRSKLFKNPVEFQSVNL